MSLSFGKITPQQKRIYLGKEEHENKFGFESAVLMSASGAGGGILHAKYINKNSGFLPKLATEPTIDKLEGALATKGDKALKPDQKRTAQTALESLKNAANAIKGKSGEALESANKKAEKLTKDASEYLKKGTKPYGKSAFAGALCGLAIFEFHRMFLCKEDEF